MKNNLIKYSLLLALLLPCGGVLADAESTNQNYDQYTTQVKVDWSAKILLKLYEHYAKSPATRYCKIRWRSCYDDVKYDGDYKKHHKYYKYHKHHSGWGCPPASPDY